MDKLGGGQPLFTDMLDMSHPIPRLSLVNKQLLPSLNMHPSDLVSQYLTYIDYAIIRSVADSIEKTKQALSAA